MPIPERVRRDAELAQRKLAELAAAQPDQSPSDTPADQPPTEAASPAPEQPAATPAPQPAAPPAPEQPGSPAVDQLIQKLEQAERRHSTLQGMYSTQTAEMQELKTRIESMTALLTQLQRQPAPAAEPPQRQKLLTDDEVRDYGEDMISVIKRAAREEFEVRMVQLAGRLDRLEQLAKQVDQRATAAHSVAAETAEDRYWSRLLDKVPSFEQINVSQDFLDWLEERDSFTGKKRGALLQEAHQQMNVERVAAFFERFAQDKGIAASPAPGGSQGKPANAPTVDLASMAAPAPAAPAPSTTRPANGKVWTTQEVEKLYNDRMRNRITPEEFAKREQEIFRAVSEGRIQS